MIDLQPQMLFGVSNFDRQSVINNNLVLAKAARVFDVPVVLSTVETKSFSGYMWPQIQAVFPNQVPIERTSMNSWDDKNFVAAIQKPVARRSFSPVCGPRPAWHFRLFRPFTTVTKFTSSRTAAAT
jgi:nicotinamidase-related amidase